MSSVTELRNKLERQKGKKFQIEKNLLNTCRMLATRRGVAIILHVPNSAAKCKGMADLPDLMFSVIRHRCGVTPVPVAIPCAVELKTKTGRLSEGQQQTLAALRSDGWVTAVIRDAEKFLEFLGGPMDREWPQE